MRKLGAERYTGIGGGTVSRASQANLEKAEELCHRRQPEKAVPYLQRAIEQDPNNLDAWIQAAFLMDRKSAVESLETTEEGGRKLLKVQLGAKCFDEEGKKGSFAGRFWSVLETRPYMRVLQAHARLSFEDEQYEKCAQTITEMLRLCPGDNLGQRSWLGSVLNRLKRYSDAMHFAQVWLESRKTGGMVPQGGVSFKEPKREIVSAEVEEELGRYGMDAMVYTAALASFKLWGDCDVSRQYLRISARVNPNVLLKVLGRIARPSSMNDLPRQRNGLEDAQDYLWLTQDLWMEDDVWAWANNNEAVKKAILKVCSRESCAVRENDVAEFKRCGACHSVSYCSPACQKADWKNHKPACQAHKERKEMLKTLMFKS